MNSATPVLSQELWRAAVEHDAHLIESYLDDDGDPDATDPNGVTMLHVCAGHGHTNLVELLIDRGANVSVSAKGGMTPIAFAAQTGRKAVVEMLLAAGADPNLRETRLSYTALDWARGNEHAEICSILQAHGAQPSGTLPQGIIDAAQRGDVPAVLRMLDQGVDVNDRADSLRLLHLAIAARKPKLVDALIDRGASVQATNKNGISPIIAASGMNQPSVVTKLLEAGADPDLAAQGGITALSVTRERGHQEVVRILEQGGALA